MFILISRPVALGILSPSRRRVNHLSGAGRHAELAAYFTLAKLVFISINYRVGKYRQHDMALNHFGGDVSRMWRHDARH